MKKLSTQDFYELRDKAFGNVVMHPNIHPSKIPSAMFVWDFETEDLVLVEYNFPKDE
jgi:hypothetical protein